MVYRYMITETNRPGWNMGLSPINPGMTSWDQEEQLEAQFYSYGCRLRDGTHNCTAFCSQPDLIWGSQHNSDADSILNNIANCFSRLKASYILELAASDPTHKIHGSYQMEEGGFQDVSTAEIIERLGLARASDTNLNLFSSSLGSCLTAYCQSERSCAPPMWTTINASNTSIVRGMHDP